MSAPDERLLYMVGNAHIDPVWLWQWQEGLHEVRATFRAALDLMDEYPDFVFTCDSVAYLAWVEQVDHGLFQRVTQRVAEGRFVIVGGWWIEPDCNLPHGESFARQALYAQRYLKERFDRTATIGCNLDPFGHAATLPQLLAKAGLRSYIFLRPEPNEKALPGELFWWTSPDGSRVLSYRVPGGYSSPAGSLDAFLQRVLDRAAPSDRRLMVLYGVGNHGGGPTRENLESINRLAEAGNGLRFCLASPEPFFDEARKRQDIPDYTGDLQHHAVGCYSAHSGVKRWNRRTEHLLMAAERWATVASRLEGGPPYPAAEIRAAWERVMFNQFHDTLAGTAIAPAYDDARDQYGYASTIAAEILNLAVQSVTRLVDLPPESGTVPFAVINPLPWPVQADVEFEMEGTSHEEVDAFDETSGQPVALQRTQSLATLGGRHRRLVLSADLPALGYRSYRLRPRPRLCTSDEGAAGALPLAPASLPGPAVLENPYLRVVIDPATGWISSFFDRERGNELAGGAPLSHAVVVDDPSDTWGHDVVAYDEEVGRFRCVSLRVTEDGPVRKVVEVVSTFGGSLLVERFVLGARARHLEICTVLDWRERQQALKLRFPSALGDPVATFSVPYGRLERAPAGTEEVAQAWVDVTGTLPNGQKAGWAVLNDGKYAYDVLGGEIGMTAARSPVYAWHDPHKLGADLRYQYLDQGSQEFSYAIFPHGEMSPKGAAQIARLAEQLNERPFALPEHFHPGPLPAARSFADDGGGQVQLCVLKQAEDGEGIILRAYEAAGKAGAARIDLKLFGRVIEADFAPGEIKTWLVPDDAGLAVEEVSLLEWALSAGAPEG